MRQNYQISEQFPSPYEEEILGFSVFAQKKFWLLHLTEDKILPITVYDENGQILSFWCFYHTQRRLITPFNAPFFIPFFANGVSMISICETVLSYCKKKYDLSIEFTLYPQSFSAQKLSSILSLKIKNVSLASRIMVSDKSFLEQIERDRKKRKLKSLLSADNYEVLKVDIKNWAEVYQENLHWRAEKSHQNPMSVDQMLKAKIQFPDAYQAFQLKRKGLLIGTAFFLKVNEKMLYVYSLIINPSLDSKEPSLLMWNAIYEWARENGFSLIDMGTSMHPKGSINKSLARYKAYIGGEFYRKHTFEC